MDLSTLIEHLRRFDARSIKKILHSIRSWTRPEEKSDLTVWDRLSITIDSTLFEECYREGTKSSDDSEDEEREEELFHKY